MNDPRFVLMAAGLEDFIFPAIVILFLVISALGQVLAKIHEAQRVEDARRRGPVPGPGGARPGAPRARGALRQEVDDFVRDGGRPPVAGRARPPQQMVEPPPPEAGWRPAFPQQGGTEQPVDVKPVELVSVPEDASVVEHVRTHVPAQEFGGMPSDVAARRTRSGDVMEGHLHDVFDHRLGALGGTPGESAEAAHADEAEALDDRISSVPVAAAAGLAAILADATSLRQAILLNEIFQRPEHRW
ncbi:MAG TPA: hypothetical protein VMY37_20830 [Thermoguttaceae bacterium]|nr:hypothetical protein [Thermoguttaceae bacterium]